MSDLSLPPALRISPEDRRAAWLASPPRPMPSFVPIARVMDAETVQILADIAEEKRRASLNRINKMKAKQSLGKVSVDTHRWNAGRGAFEPIQPPEWKLQRGRDEHARFMQIYPDAVILDADAPAPVVKKSLDPLAAVNKLNCRRIAEINGVWKDAYGDLQAGLMCMSVKNALKRLVKAGNVIIGLD